MTQPSPPPPPPRCPICGRPRDHRLRPFRSARCRDQDLLKWLDGKYAIPAVDAEDDDLDDGPVGAA